MNHSLISINLLPEPLRLPYLNVSLCPLKGRVQRYGSLQDDVVDVMEEGIGT